MVTGTLPVRRVSGPLEAALAPAVLTDFSAEELLPFLLERRWFGAKGRTPVSVAVSSVIPLRWESLRASIAVVEIVFGGGRVERYQLPLSVRRDGAPGDPPRAVLARVESDDEHGVLLDATEDPTFRRQLAASLEHSASFEDAGARLIAEPVGDGAVGLGAVADTRVIASEQSNTSIVYGDRAILKLFRRLETGENPDVEISRFLTLHTDFRNAPPLLGMLRVEAADGTSSVTGMLQQYLPGSRDAWSHALESGRPFFSAPSDDAPANPFRADAERLGTITRDLHEALASPASHGDPAFAPVAIAPADVAGWAAEVRRSAAEALALLDDRLAAGALPAERVGEARVLARRRDDYLAHIDSLGTGLDERLGQRIRHHGDYHLGQVLRTADGDFMIIDFEGEPARPLAERRAPHAPLRDVAGMLRSFAYAAATLATGARETLPPRVLEPRTHYWERDARDAFLQGYLRDAHAPFLPQSRRAIDRILTLFETEKVFYELSYELNNRPDWVWIPLRGISRLLVAPADGARQ
ncbi:MAG TPA: hypothetical protein VMM18_17045 [Gemmatimonadaceae bacterium]|nr:hypothetical protein [Gemmatimonadaceae bacterium]